MTESYLIDDFADPPRASNGNPWRFFSDQVMGGVSDGGASCAEIDGRRALRLAGDVSLNNNGGFIQIALDLAGEGDVFDASGFHGVAVTQQGDGRRYAVNLRSSDVRRPWQSYRAPFVSTADWQTLYLPFSVFTAHRIDRPLNTRELKRIGLIAIGEAGPVSLSVSRVALYREIHPT